MIIYNQIMFHQISPVNLQQNSFTQFQEREKKEIFANTSKSAIVIKPPTNIALNYLQDTCLLTYRQIGVPFDVVRTDCTCPSTLFNTRTEIHFIKHLFVCINCFPSVTEKTKMPVSWYSSCLNCISPRYQSLK